LLVAKYFVTEITGFLGASYFFIAPGRTMTVPAIRLLLFDKSFCFLILSSGISYFFARLERVSPDFT
jgi:hypothetical protein